MRQLRGKFSHLLYLPWGATLVWAAAKGWLVAWVVVILIAGLTPAVGIALTKRLVDAIVRATQAGGSWETVTPVLITAAALGATSLLIEVLQAVAEWLRTVQTELIQDYLAALVQK